MRPFYQDITGKTDGSGNASISVKLPQTGEWHDLKFAIGTTAATEWAINVNGRPYTFGRGRRVTLGPELIQDGETVTVSATGGPINSNIDGTATGKSGSPEEIMALFTPSPNTIALDSATPATVLDRIDMAAGSGNRVYPVPAGTVSIGFGVDGDVLPPPPGVVNRGTLPSQIVMRGYPTGFNYILATLAQIQVTNQLAALIDPRDTQFSIAWTIAANPFNSFIDVFTSPADLAKQFDVIGNQIVSLQLATPAPWQAATSSKAFGISPAGLNTDFTVIPGVAGKTIYVHDLNVVMNATANYEFALWDGPSANGLQVVELAQVFATAVGVLPNLRWDGKGRPLTAGNALIGTQISGPGGLKFFGTLGYSQA